MSERKQEKLGWVGGWLGGFVWVFILSIISLVRGEILQALLGLVIVGGASTCVFIFSPWRYPEIQYRVLMLPIYTLLFLAMIWGVWASGGLSQLGINSWWSIFFLLPILIPFWTLGNRRWGSDDV